VKRLLAVTALSLCVSACGGGLGGLLGGSKPAPPTFDLFAPQAFPRTSRPPRGLLVVPEATALPPFDSEKIVVRPDDIQVTALDDAQWNDRLPRLVQARIIQTFENANRLRAVGRPSDRLTANYQLLLDIRAFQISVPAGPAAEVEISVKLVADRAGRIFAARVFRVSVPAAAVDGPNATAALNAAFARAATDIVLWTARII
jgi:ABC-type uncharacterized transport system auxiliary subunit